MKTSFTQHVIGVDLGNAKHAICVTMQSTGEIIDERSITNHRESLRRLSKKYPGALMAMEVGSHSPWISRFLEDLDHEVLVANPGKMRAIFKNDRKCDLYDARMLAKIRFGGGWAFVSVAGGAGGGWGRVLLRGGGG